MWNWVKTIVDSVFGTKAKEASTQTDPVTTGTSGTSSVKQEITQDASTQAAPSETASQLSGASTAPTLFGSFSRKPPKVLVGGNDTKVKEWLNNGDIDVTKKKLAEQAIMAEVMKAQYAMEKKLKEEQEAKLTLQEEEYQQAKIEAESKRASMYREAQKNAHYQATARAEEEACAARIWASAIRIANPNKFRLNTPPTAIAPEPEGGKVPNKILRFNPEEQKTWDGPEAKKPPTRTHKKVPKNQGGKKVTIQDSRTAWERERDEFMKESKAGAVKRKVQIEESRTRTQKLLTNLVDNQPALDSYDDRVNAYAKANNLSNTSRGVYKLSRNFKEGYRNATDQTLVAKAKASKFIEAVNESKAVKAIKETVTLAKEMLGFESDGYIRPEEQLPTVKTLSREEFAAKTAPQNHRYRQSPARSMINDSSSRNGGRT